MALADRNFSCLSRHELLVKKSSKRHVKRLYPAILCLLTVVAALFVTLFHGSAQSPAYTITDLGVAGTTSKANGINNCGQVAGASSFGAFHPTDPAFWNGGSAIDLGAFNGDSSANAVNSSGAAVGNVLAQANRAFIWRDANGNGISDSGELVDLGTL